MLSTLKHHSEIMIRKINQKKQWNVKRFIALSILCHSTYETRSCVAVPIGSAIPIARNRLEIFRRDGSVLRDELGANALGHRHSVITANIW
jgi:hypothetical protein